LEKRKKVRCCYLNNDDSNNDVWLNTIILDGGLARIRKRAERKLGWKREIEDITLAGGGDPVLKIPSGDEFMFINKRCSNTKDLLKNHFKYRYGREPVWGQVQDTTGEQKTNDVTNPSAPKVEP
jgi:hypothetical protein